MTTIRLNLLESARIASPCTASWEQMKGDDRVRYCGECRLNVYNISAMTRDEAEALIAGSEGRLCARLYRRADGTVITSDCPIGLRWARMKAAKAAARIAAAAAVLLGGSMTLARLSGGHARLRQLQPFATICGWLSPAPAPVPMGAIAMGKVCAVPSAPTPAATPTGESAEN